MRHFSVFDNLALLELLPVADPLHGDGDGQLDGAARPGPVVLAEVPPAAVVAATTLIDVMAATWCCLLWLLAEVPLL